VSVITNKAIADALGDEAQGFAEFLERAGAAAIRQYPTLEITFEAGRLFGEPKPIAGHKYTGCSDAGVLVEKALRELADEAVERLRQYDPDAFITVFVNSRAAPKRLGAYRCPPEIRSWRGFIAPSISTICRVN
jgi:hypothetical protein